jgi:hypothetical protein
MLVLTSGNFFVEEDLMSRTSLRLYNKYQCFFEDHEQTMHHPRDDPIK